MTALNCLTHPLHCPHDPRFGCVWRDCSMDGLEHRAWPPKSGKGRSTKRCMFCGLETSSASALRREKARRIADQRQTRLWRTLEDTWGLLPESGPDFPWYEMTGAEFADIVMARLELAGFISHEERLGTTPTPPLNRE